VPRDPWCSMCPCLYECMAWGVTPRTFECETVRYNAGHLAIEQTSLYAWLSTAMASIFREVRP